MSPPAAPLVLVFDASPLTSWILQTAGQWQRVDKLLKHSAVSELVVPASALTETLYSARLAGNTTDLGAMSAALLAQGLRVEPITGEDVVWAADRIAESRQNPATWTTADGRTETSTLSLGDGLVLAVAERLGGLAATFDVAWFHFPTMEFRTFNVWKVPL